jgi:NAD+ diphosphatase
MTFTPALRPPVGVDRAQRWFLFRDDRILVHRQADNSVCPYLNDVSLFETAFVRKQYLGYLRRIDCYAAELSRDTSLPTNSELHRVRRLLGEVDDELLGIAGRANQMIHWAQTHKFCGRCGQPTRDMENERAKICPPCGLINYPRVSPAVIVAVLNGHRLLLARSTRIGSSYHSVLAGFVEPGETLEDCVRREVKEEVGIRVKNIRYFGSQPWPFPNALMVAFTAEYAGGDIRVNPSEIVDAEWFDAAALPRIPGKWSISRQLIDWFAKTFA